MHPLDSTLLKMPALRLFGTYFEFRNTAGEFWVRREILSLGHLTCMNLILPPASELYMSLPTPAL